MQQVIDEVVHLMFDDGTCVLTTVVNVCIPVSRYLENTVLRYKGLRYGLRSLQ